MNFLHTTYTNTHVPYCTRVLFKFRKTFVSGATQSSVHPAKLVFHLQLCALCMRGLYALHA